MMEKHVCVKRTAGYVRKESTVTSLKDLDEPAGGNIFSRAFIRTHSNAHMLPYKPLVHIPLLKQAPRPPMRE